MTIHRLTVFDPAGRIITYFTQRQDAEETYRATYSKVEAKPRYVIEPVDVLERSTHL